MTNFDSTEILYNALRDILDSDSLTIDDAKEIAEEALDKYDVATSGLYDYDDDK